MDEENYVRMQLLAVGSLAVASAKNPSSHSEAEIQQIVEVVQSTRPVRAAGSDSWRNRILWVDDRPQNNVHERQAFEAMGLVLTLALSTSEAFERLSSQKFAAIISDMGRKEGPREGYVLLDELRKEDTKTPFFIYASSKSPEHRRETAEHLGQGCTNDPQELFQMETRAVFTRVAQE